MFLKHIYQSPRIASRLKASNQAFSNPSRACFKSRLDLDRRIRRFTIRARMLSFNKSAPWVSELSSGCSGCTSLFKGLLNFHGSSYPTRQWHLLNPAISIDICRATFPEIPVGQDHS